MLDGGRNEFDILGRSLLDQEKAFCEQVLGMYGSSRRKGRLLSRVVGGVCSWYVRCTYGAISDIKFSLLRSWMVDTEHARWPA